MSDTPMVHAPTEDKTYMTQGEFEDHAANKKELYDFFLTQNVFLCNFDVINTDYLSGCFSEEKKYCLNKEIICRQTEYNE